jgi:hypothetical protein
VASRGVLVNFRMDQPAKSETRLTARTNLFVMAVICAGLSSEPVRVRNLSTSGALVEGAVLPQPGTQVRLCRADLDVEGEVMWCKDGRAGLQFGSSVIVADWLPQGSAKAGQQRVDRLVQKLKSDGLSASPSSVAIGENDRKDFSAQELNHLRKAVESLAEDLAADAAIVEHHSSKLQTLDIVAQALGKLAASRD